MLVECRAAADASPLIVFSRFMYTKRKNTHLRGTWRETKAMLNGGEHKD